MCRAAVKVCSNMAALEDTIMQVDDVGLAATKSPAADALLEKNVSIGPFCMSCAADF